MQHDLIAHRKVLPGALLLLLVAVAIRVAAVIAIGSYRLDHVTYEHGEIARNLVEGRGFVVRWMGAEGPTSQQAPVYPSIVAAFYWLFGVQTPQSLFALQLFQAVLGGLIPGFVVLLTLELQPARWRLVWWAGWGAALYPTLIYAVTQVQVATLLTLLVLIELWSATQVVRTGRCRWAIACGATAGLLALTDPIMILILLVALAMILIRTVPAVELRLDASSMLLTGITLSAFASTLAPWLMRNYLVHGEPVFVQSTFGYAFWQGNHPKSFGTDKIPLVRSSGDAARAWSFRAMEQSLWRTRLVDTMYIDDAVLANERIDQLGRLTEPRRSAALLREATEYILNHPAHYARLCLRRLHYFLLFDETNPKSHMPVYRIAHMTLQVLAVLGLWWSRNDWRTLWPTYLAFGLVTAFHVLTIVSARFHIPLEPLECIWAGSAGDAAVRLIGFRWAVRRPGWFGGEMPGTPICSGLSHS